MKITVKAAPKKKAAAKPKPGSFAAVMAAAAEAEKIQLWKYIKVYR